jgi:hypothetical protein
MKWKLLLTLVIGGACGGDVLAQATWQPVKVEKTWNGQIPKEEVTKLEKDMDVNWKNLPNVIVKPAAWKKVWSAWNPGQPVPEVDFTKNLVLVHLQDAADPNKVKHNVQLNDEGILRVLSISTLIGFQPSDQRKFTLMLVPRAGVKKMEVPGKGIVALPAM